ncbi:unnamed protein product [Schistosoma turkestanicum]|nr:unnamed protein product [Schistosoma turkestanicum]
MNNQLIVQLMNKVLPFPSVIMNAFSNWTELNTPWDTLIDCILVDTKHPDASYLACWISKLYGILFGYVYPIIGTLNLMTNTIVAVIFLLLIHPKNRYFIFLGILAIADIGMNIFIGWLGLFPAYGLPYISSGTIYYFILTISSLYCRLFKSIQMFWCNLRGNMYILLAFDRLLLMQKPIIQKISSKHYTGILLIITIIISSIMIAPIVIYTDLFANQQLITCWFTDYSTILTFYEVLFSNSCLFQLTFVSLIDIIFLVKIIHWSHEHCRMTKHHTTITTTTTTTTTVNLKSKQISKIITLLLLNILSFICSAPSGIFYMILASNQVPKMELVRLLIILIHISWSLILLQSSFNILLYYKRIEKFRHVLLKLTFIKFIRMKLFTTNTATTNTATTTTTTTNTTTNTTNTTTNITHGFSTINSTF